MIFTQYSDLAEPEAYRLSSATSVDVSKKLVVPKIHKVFSIHDGSDRWLSFGARQDNVELATNLRRKPVLTLHSISANGLLVFPYSADNDNSEYMVASLIQESLFDYIYSEIKESPLCCNYMVMNLIYFGLGGTKNPAGFTYNGLLEYQNFKRDTNNRIYHVVKEGVEKVTKFTQEKTSLIGLRDPYTYKGLGVVFNLLRDNWTQLLIVGLAVLFFIFAIKRSGIFGAVVKTLVLTVFSYVYLVIVPLYFPTVYNFFINMMMENLAYEALAVSTEQHAIQNDVTTRLSTTGDFSRMENSITLYREQSKELEKFYESIGVTTKDVTGGNAVVLNQSAGIYVEGDSIKVNLDVLFDTLKIQGSYTDVDVPVYQFELVKTTNSNIDYFTPYHLMADCLIEQLNKFARVHTLQRKVTTYALGVERDNYLVYSYTHSSEFLSPNEQETQVLREYYDDDASFEKDSAAEEALKKRVKDAFHSTSDFLGIQSIFVNLADVGNATYDDWRTSLWGRTLQRRGYFSKEWEVDEEMATALIQKVNVQVKDFIFKQDHLIGTVSDDTLIKVITLRTVIAFSQAVSGYGNWIYPFNLNFEDITVGNLMSVLFASDYNRLTSVGLNAVSYIGGKYHVFGLVGYGLCSILFYGISWLVSVSVMLLYFSFLVVIPFKLATGTNVLGIVYGLRRCVITLFVISNLLSVLIALIYKFGGNGASLVVMILALIVLILIWCYSVFVVIKDPGNLGGQNLHAKVDKGASKNDGVTVNKVDVHNVQSKNLGYEKQAQTNLTAEQKSRFSRYLINRDR